MDFRQAALQRLAMQGGGKKGPQLGPFGTTTPVVTSIPVNNVGQHGPFDPPGLPDNAGTLGKIGDPRSTSGIFSRGANVYNGGSMSAHRGPNVNMGRPNMKEIAKRRLMMGGQ